MSALKNLPSPEFPLGGGTLHIGTGEPWREALAALESESRLWQYPTMVRGDLLLTVLRTRPALAVCLERVFSFNARSQMATIDAILWRGAVSVAAIEGRAGLRLRALPRTLGDDESERVLAALSQEVDSPTPLRSMEGKCSPSTTRYRSSGLQAAALLASAGRCASCERNFGELLEGAGLAALEVHHLQQFADVPTTVETGVEDVVVVCGGCHNMLHDSTRPSVLELTYAWRPRCPKCAAKRADRVSYGEPLNPPGPGEAAGGCLLQPGDHATWSCASCEHQWRTSALEA